MHIKAEFDYLGNYLQEKLDMVGQNVGGMKSLYVGLPTFPWKTESSRI